MRYVIVGGGIAGTTAAEELRKLQPDAEITIVSEEQHPVYSRVLLPHYLKGKVPRERVFLKQPDWYEKNNIEWLTGTRVEKLDVKNNFVALSEGREIEYDKVLIATGGEVLPIGEDLRGVSYFRTVDDADHLLQLVGERAADARAAIYGGGFIACEYLNFFAQEKIPTTIAFRGPHFWSRIFDAESGKLLNDHLRAGGVEVITDAGSGLELVGDQHLTAIKLPTGQTIPCSILGVGVGIKTELEWIRDAGVEVDHGVKANEYLETNAPNVYAAGDNAEFFDVVVGHHRLVGNWMNAQMQGRMVAKSMAGERTPFRLVSSYATNALGLEIIFVGETDRSQTDEIVVRGSAEAKGVTQVFLKNHKVVGATILGRNKDRAPITKLVNDQSDVAAQDLETLLP